MGPAKILDNHRLELDHEMKAVPAIGSSINRKLQISRRMCWARPDLRNYEFSKKINEKVCICMGDRKLKVTNKQDEQKLI